MGKKFKQTPTGKKHDRYERAAKGQIRTKAYNKGYKEGLEKGRKKKNQAEYRRGYNQAIRDFLHKIKNLKEKLLDELSLSESQETKLRQIFDKYRN